LPSAVSRPPTTPVSIELHPLLSGDAEVEVAGEELRVVERTDRLRDLFGIDHPIVQAAVLPVGENGGEDGERGIIRRVCAVGPPDEIHLGERNAVLEGDVAGSRDGRHRDLRPLNGRAGGNPGEIALDESVYGIGLDISRDDDDRVVGDVIALEEALHVLTRGG
jgi:hypothetical protein